MIRYRLKCGGGHEFDAWFASSIAYETQETEGRLVCPHCARTDIERAIMAPQITAGRTHAGERENAGKRADTAETSADVTSTAPPPAGALRAGNADAQRLQALMREMRSLRDKILEKSEYVGPRFAEEARRIHHEETPDRPIHGEATAQEVHDLAEDGIDVMPVPHLPDDLN